MPVTQILERAEHFLLQETSEERPVKYVGVIVRDTVQLHSNEVVAKTFRAPTLWAFAFTASSNASRISAISGTSRVASSASNGDSKTVRPSFSIQSGIAMPHLS